MEIEKKFLIKHLPKNLNEYKKISIEQGYILDKPALRIRKEDENYYLTYKALKKDDSFLERIENNISIDKEAYYLLLKKCDGIIIKKDRYLIYENDFLIELDIFLDKLSGLIIAEVEFPSVELANSYKMPSWFLREVTNDFRYSNSHISKYGFDFSK